MRVLVTGAAGFIGFHVARALIARGDAVTGFDNVNAYYDVALKEARLSAFKGMPAFEFRKLDISDRDAMLALAGECPAISGIVHLAAQPGVRYSLINPYAYVQANVMGHLVMLEMARALPALRHFVYASSSSVYGANTKMPFAVGDLVEHPNSLYAATKRADELIGHTYAHLYGIPATGLRFFTVYGPWGRPDMAPMLFARAITAGEPIKVFNHGEMWRDFTYIDDIVEGVVRTADTVATPDPGWRAEDPDPATSSAPYRLYNIGNHSPVALLDYIAVIEDALGRKAELEMLPAQPGDVPETYADVEALKQAVGFEPSTPIQDGVKRFVAWYREFYGV